MGNEDKVVSVRFDKADFKLLEKDAKEQERKVSNLLKWCWKQWRKGKKK